MIMHHISTLSSILVDLTYIKGIGFKA